VVPPAGMQEPHLIQVIRVGNWAYPLYLDGDSTRVVPLSGMPLAEVKGQPTFELDLERKTA